MEKRVQVALFGIGCMGEAMVRGLLQHKGQMSVWGIGRRQDRLEELSGRYPEAGFARETNEAVAQCDALVLCVKPQQLHEVAPLIKGVIREQSLLISILAGTSIQSLQANFGHRHVVRAMPNTPGQIGRGYTGWCHSDSVSEEQLALTKTVLGSLGVECRYAHEPLLDTVTAISGSGPGTFAYLIQAYIEAAVKNGMTRANAREAVLRTVLGTAEYLLESQEHPALLQDRVTSPGGTTAAIVYQLDKAGVRAAVTTSIDAGIARCRELNQS